MKSPSSKQLWKKTRRPLAFLCLVSAGFGQAGCGREFFRQWANQDVSEVIFEKSRDPRFRIDLFSVDPPAMSRYADPYDPDRPPAPPDDYATQALTPVPQWSDNRLIIPVEGTGYLEMLETYQPQNYAQKESLIELNRRIGEGKETSMFGIGPDAATPPYSSTPAPAPPPPRTPSPFPPGTNEFPRRPDDAPDDPRLDPDPLRTPAIPGDPTPREIQSLAKPLVPQLAPGPRGTMQPNAVKPVAPGTVPGAPAATPIPGTTPPQTSPLNVPGGVPSTPPNTATPAPARPAPGPSAKNSLQKDDGVRLAAFQNPTTPATPAAPAPNPAPASTPAPAGARGTRPSDPRTATGAAATPGAPNAPATPPSPNTPPVMPLAPGEASEDPRKDRDPLQTPAIPGDPTPREIQDLSKPGNPRIDLSPKEAADAQAAGSELLGLLGSGIIDVNDNQAIGLSKERRPYIVTMGQAVTLALINARVYQTELENLYLQAIPVTANRFAFSPQFIAGLSPTTGTVGPLGTGLSPSTNPANVFNYRTRATGLQQSGLTMGTVAAVGKNFDNGAKILAGFASQVVFNFTGKNPAQPTVNSYLPLNVVVPFLKGGGRAVTLEPLTQAERNLVYQIRAFAKFRQEFLITTLVGGSSPNFATGVVTPGFSAVAGALSPGNVDPVTGYINVLEDFVIVENNTRNIATLVQFAEVFKELIKGESSGITQLQVDQLDANIQSARQQLISTRNNLRGDMDGLKMQLGLPPDTPMTVDRTLTQPFKAVFQEVEHWARDPKRQLEQLDFIAAKLPQLEDVVIDGRSITEAFRSTTSAANATTANEDYLEDLLIAAERVALENRLDLMNTRAQLYDAWRQVRVTANALKGVFNVNLTNQYLTPPTTTNPFGFLSQAKQFSLVIQAELPLVRINERNAFRTALINYQRSRRNLQSQEDYVKLQLRGDVRGIQVSFLNYELIKRNFVLFARQKDQSFENIVAPPQGGATTGTAGANASGAIQTQNLIQAQNSLIGFENNLVTQWYLYQVARLLLYRDLGTLPYDEWESFYELFPAQYNGLGVGGDGVSGGAPTGGPDSAKTQVNRP